MLALVALLAITAGLPGPAQAADANSQAVVPLPDFPNLITVGDRNVPTVLRLINESVGFGPLTLSNIRLNPACGDQFGGCAQPDRGVITLSPTGNGRVGTACAGQTFTISGPDLNDQYTFTPGVPVMLQPPDAIAQIGPDTCFIDYTFNVVKAPTLDAGPNSPGLQTAHFALVDSIGTTIAAPVETRSVLNNSGTSISTVLLAQPRIDTVAKNGILGQPISDTATVTGPLGAPTPGRTVTFTLFGPDNATCTGIPVFTSTTPLGADVDANKITAASPANDAAAVSGTFTPTAPGDYRWVAVYSGDANFASVTSPCGAPNETSTVTRPVAAINTVATGSRIGEPIRDVATVTTVTPGAPAPTGTVTFTLFQGSCAGPLVFTSSDRPILNGVATSADFLPPTATSYFFAATYNGDTRFLPITSPCGAPNEEAKVMVATPQITTQASPAVARAGAPLQDTATLTGGFNPTGTITFNLYGPTDAKCEATPVFTSNPVVNGNGNYLSGPYNANQPGTYRWRASYSGDANNAPAGPGACGDPTEINRVLGPPLIMVDKTVTPAVRLEPGGEFTFSVRVLNTGPNPVTITSLTDDIYGSLTDPANTGPAGTNLRANTCLTALGRALAADPDGAGTGVEGGFFNCSFTVDFDGRQAGDTQTDIVTAVAVDELMTRATDDDDATITITNVVPSINIEKTATPETRPEPGGLFTFNVVVTNTSIESVKITSLVDDKYPNLVGRGSCINAIGFVIPANGGTYTCAFTGEFRGNDGDAQTDVVTVIAEDDDKTVVTDNDDATVSLTGVAPTVLVDKTATPLTMGEPGGSFTFNVVVTNTSFEPVTITALTDDIYGDISGKGTCTNAKTTVLAGDPDGAGQALGGIYRCSFTGEFRGDAGASQTDIVSTTVVDDDGDTASDTDDAIVTLTDVKPTVVIDKVATPTTRVAPGGEFTFNVKVTNTSPEDVTITVLTDDVYENIATKGTCTNAIGTILKPGESYSCSFTGTFTGTAGQSQTDTVTVTVTDDDDNTVTDTDDAKVTLTAVPPGTAGQQVNNVVRVPVAGPAPTLPRTGTAAVQMAALALGLLLTGGLLLVAARWTSATGLASMTGLAAANRLATVTRAASSAGLASVTQVRRRAAQHRLSRRR